MYVRMYVYVRIINAYHLIIVHYDASVMLFIV